VYVQLHGYNRRFLMYICTCVYVYMHVCVWIYVRAGERVHVCEQMCAIRACVYVHLYIYIACIDMYIYTYTQTQTHTHTHSHTMASENIQASMGWLRLAGSLK